MVRRRQGDVADQQQSEEREAHAACGRDRARRESMSHDMQPSCSYYSRKREEARKRGEL